MIDCPVRSEIYFRSSSISARAGLYVLTLVKTSGTQTLEYHFGDGIIRGTEVMYFEKDHLWGNAKHLMPRNENYFYGYLSF